MNSIINTSIMLMSTMMDTFKEVMVNTTGAMASGMADVIAGKEASHEVNKEFRKKLPEVDEKMKAMISEVRKDVYAQLREKRKEMKSLLSDSAFDSGPKIVEKYDFRLPRLTEKLGDNTLAQYTQLLISEDPRFAKMFKELTSWMEHIPKFPAKTYEK
jgi:F0F1-type ATP synthase membrane subunit b/b'